MIKMDIESESTELVKRNITVCDVEVSLANVKVLIKQYLSLNRATLHSLSNSSKLKMCQMIKE